MAVIAAFEAPIAELVALAPQVAALVASAASPADISDTVAAIQSAADGIKTALTTPAAGS